MLGLGIPPLRLDEIQIVLRTHIFFKLVQDEWLTRLKTNHTYLPLTKDSEANLNTGGDCLVFDVLDELKVAFRHDKEIQEHILTNLKPDILFERRPDRQDLELQYLMLKVTNRIAKMGKDSRWVFEQFDTDGNGTRKSFICSLTLCCSRCSRDSDGHKERSRDPLLQRGNQHVCAPPRRRQERGH